MSKVGGHPEKYTFHYLKGELSIRRRKSNYSHKYTPINSGGNPSV